MQKPTSINEEVTWEDLELGNKPVISRTDLKGIITYVNKAFCKLCGYDKEELIGKPHSINRHPDMPKSTFKNLWQTIKNDQKWHSVVPIKTYQPNKLSVYEICGNVMEWCLDVYAKDYYSHSPELNPQGVEMDIFENGTQMQSIRGGAWSFDSKKMITFYRSAAKANTRANFIGFRVVKR